MPSSSLSVVSYSNRDTADYSIKSWNKVFGEYQAHNSNARLLNDVQDIRLITQTERRQPDRNKRVSCGFQKHVFVGGRTPY